MISPVPSTGSGNVSMASGDPNALRTAAFMMILLSGGAIMIADFPIAGRPGIILGLDGPSQVPLPSEGVMVMADPRRSEFGDFLRSRREKLSPKAVGIPGGRRRRTAGLRREEVAELAGIGVDWYIRMEQGRTVSPSVTTIDALARALRLGKAEHKHLRALTQNTDRRAFVPETVPPAVRRTVERLNLPAYVTGRRWDILMWNAAADEIFAFSKLP